MQRCTQSDKVFWSHELMVELGRQTLIKRSNRTTMLHAWAQVLQGGSSRGQCLDQTRKGEGGGRQNAQGGARAKGLRQGDQSKPWSRRAACFSGG